MDCASRATFPAGLKDHVLWWEGPRWLKDAENEWNVRVEVDEHQVFAEEHDLQWSIFPANTSKLPLLDRISTYDCLVCHCMDPSIYNKNSRDLRMHKLLVVW